MSDPAELTTVWARGWAVSRGRPPPVAVPGGLMITLDRPGPVSRYVVDAGDWAAAAVLGRELTVPGTEIKIAGPAACLRAALSPEWTMYDPHHLMTVGFTPGRAEVPPSCTAHVGRDGGALLASIHDRAGAVAASGRLAASGRYGVVDRVWTRPADRRRGLGRAVLTMLGTRALADGLTTGLLSATVQGRALYSALGWAVRSELAGAFRP